MPENFKIQHLTDKNYTQHGSCSVHGKFIIFFSTFLDKETFMNIMEIRRTTPPGGDSPDLTHDIAANVELVVMIII